MALQVTVGCAAAFAGAVLGRHAKADRALYRSKLIGRNRVTRYSMIAERPSKNWLLYKKD